MFDIAPTILEAVGLEIPNDFEAEPLWGALTGNTGYRPREAVYAELARDHIQTGSEFILMRRDRKWKIVLYFDDTYGELYDLQADPDEGCNLWNVEGFRSVRDELKTQCLTWFARATLTANRRASRKPQQAMRI